VENILTDNPIQFYFMMNNSGAGKGMFSLPEAKTVKEEVSIHAENLFF
jgi:hypothetical protein